MKIPKADFRQRLQAALSKERRPLYEHEETCHCDVCLTVSAAEPNLSGLTIYTPNNAHAPRFKLKSMKDGTVRIRMFDDTKYSIITPTPESAVASVMAILHLVNAD